MTCIAGTTEMKDVPQNYRKLSGHDMGEFA